MGVVSLIKKSEEQKAENVMKILKLPNSNKMVLIDIQGVFKLSETALQVTLQSEFTKNNNNNNSNNNNSNNNNSNNNKNNNSKNNNNNKNKKKIGDLSFDEKTEKYILVVGQYQKLQGDLKKLKNPIAVCKMTDVSGEEPQNVPAEILDVITHKLVFHDQPINIIDDS